MAGLYSPMAGQGSAEIEALGIDMIPPAGYPWAGAIIAAVLLVVVVLSLSPFCRAYLYRLWQSLVSVVCLRRFRF